MMISNFWARNINNADLTLGVCVPISTVDHLYNKVQYDLLDGPSTLGRRIQQGERYLP